MHLIFFREGFNSAFTFHEQAIKIVTVWPNIALACRTARDPTVFDVSARLHADKVQRIGLTRDLMRL